jgi:hypothetical protein
MRLLPLLAALILLPTAAFGQGSIIQAGPTTPGHAPSYANQGQVGSQAVIQDSGPAGGGAGSLGLSELNVTARGTGSGPYVGLGTGPLGTVSCIQDAPTANPAGYHFLCSSANVANAGLIAYGIGGIAPQQPLLLNINGTSYNLPGSFGLLAGNNIWTGTNTFNALSTFTGLIASSGTNTFTGANTFSTGTLTISSPITDTGVNTWSGGNTFQTLGTTFTSGITSSGTNTWSGPNTFSSSDLILAGATSGTTTLIPAATASGTATLPANTGQIAELNLAQTWTAAQTITNSDLKLLGSSTGNTTFASANASSSNYTMTVPAVTDTLAVLGTAQSWTAAQTFNNSDIKLLGSSTGATTFTSANAGASNYTLTLPAATDTVAVLGTAQTFSASETFSGQIIPAYGTPTIASGTCGTGSNGAVANGSTNQSGEITIGASATSTCTLAFSTTLGAAPLACTISPGNAAAAAWGTTGAYVSSITTGHFIITGTLANANYYYHCL